MSFDYRRRFAPSPYLRIQDATEGAEAAPKTISGHAAVFNEWYVLHQSPACMIREIIRPGAFKNAISSGQDVRCLIDHNPTLILGRTKAGTLVLSEDAKGLFFSCSLPDTSAAEDIAENVRLENVSQCSFAFTLRDGGETVVTRTENGVTIQEIEVTDVDLYDVSVVTYPAYESTDVSVRSKALAKQVKEAWLKSRRLELERLSARASK